MERAEGRFVGAGGMELFYQCWQPAGKPRAVLAIIHGFGEHSGRYANVVRHLTALGYVVYGLDHRGHGRSPGQRGHINDWTEYREDVKAFCRRIREQEHKHPLFLFGHSMGALITLDFVLCYPEGLHGAIVSGVPIEPAGVAKPYLVALGRLLSRLWPNFSLSLGLETSAISRDPMVVEGYETDPLVHGLATARWGTECLATLERVNEHAGDIDIPILFLHGEADRLNLARGCRHFFELVGCVDKTLRIYPQTYHEPHNDINYQQVMSDLEDWLDQHL